MANIEYAAFVDILTADGSPDLATDYVVTKDGVTDAVRKVTPNNLVGKASTTEVLTGTDTLKAVTPDSLAALWEKGADIASAGTVSIGEGGYFHITGTTTITDIDPATDKAGRAFWLEFDGILTLTHHATTLILPTGANITTAAGDTALFISEGSDAVRCMGYERASGAAVSGLTGSGTTNRMSKWTASTALGDSLLTSNTTDVSPSAAGTIGFGTNALPFTGVYIGNAATNNILLTGTATSAKTVTLPDATGTALVAASSPTANRIPKLSAGYISSDSLLTSNTTDVSPSAAGTIGLGTNALPFTGIYIGNAATNNIQLTGTATAARVATFPDATGTVLLAPTGLTTNYLPRAVSAGTFGDTPNSWDGTTYAWSNTALSTTFAMTMVPNSTTGSFTVGDFSGATYGNRIKITETDDTVSVISKDRLNLFGSVDGSTLTTYIQLFAVDGDILQVANSDFTIQGNSSLNLQGQSGTPNIKVLSTGWEFNSTGSDKLLNLSGANNIQVLRTITAAADTGNKTIEKPAGTLNIAAAGTAVTLTNATITTSSLIIPFLRTNDATAKSVIVVAGTGSAVFTLNAACTAEVSVGFLITN